MASKNRKREALATELKRVRLFRVLTQKQAAKEIGISLVTLNRLENMKTIPIDFVEAKIRAWVEGRKSPAEVASVGA